MTLDEKALQCAMEAYSPQTQGLPDRGRLSRAITAYLQALRSGSTGEAEGWRDVVTFLDSIEGHGYGGMASYEVARSSARAMLAAAGGRDE